MTGTSFIRSSRVMMAPVGLFGYGSTRILERGVQAASSASGVSLNRSSFRSRMIAGFASASTAQGS